MMWRQSLLRPWCNHELQGRVIMVETRRKPILVVEDDPLDREMIELAFKRAAVDCPIVAVSDGQEALDYLQAQGQFRERHPEDLPAVIILDLAMPRVDGFEFLRRVKPTPDLAAIPVVVLTTSEFDKDLRQSYELKANSCITKPGDFERLVEVAHAVHEYWCEINQVPKSK
jgi:two-component system response regulator